MPDKNALDFQNC